MIALDQKPAPGEGRLERKKEATRQKIVSVALRLFQKHGFDATTMEEIAEQADIAKGTLYNYFPVKEAILDEFIQRSFREQHAARMLRLQHLPDTRSRLRAILSELLEGIQVQREIFKKYFVYRIQQMLSLDQDESAQSGLHLLEARIIELGQHSGEVRSDLPLDLLSGLFEFVFIKLAQQFYREPERFEARRAIEQGVELFMNAVKAE
jgi:AcrR family transcriptional regulator